MISNSCLNQESTPKENPNPKNLSALNKEEEAALQIIAEKLGG
jgi:hypothetical protein